MQNLTEKQQKDVTKLIIKAEKNGTAKLTERSGATNVYDVPAPWEGTDGNGKAFLKDRKINLWRSPEKEGKVATVNVYIPNYFRRARKATETPVTPIETPTVPETKPTIAEEQKPAPVPAGASDTMDADSVNHIIQSAKANGARRVTVAVVTF